MDVHDFNKANALGENSPQRGKKLDLFCQSNYFKWKTVFVTCHAVAYLLILSAELQNHIS